MVFAAADFSFICFFAWALACAAPSAAHVVDTSAAMAKAAVILHVLMTGASSMRDEKVEFH
jgi:hypothetical protein